MTEVDLTAEQIALEVQPIAVRVARTVAQNFKGYIEQGDITQDLLLWALEHDVKIREYLTPTEDDKRCQVGRRKLHTTFRRRAYGQAHMAKADRLGYSVDDLHFYSNASLEELLPRALNYDEWLTSTPNDGTPKSKADPALGNDLLALLCDVKWSYEQASADDQALLCEWLYDGADMAVLAADAGVTKQTMERRAQRALSRMGGRLGGTRPEFRSVMSNAAAQHLTRMQLEA